MRMHRLYHDHQWRVQLGLTEKCRERLNKILQRSVELRKLQHHRSSPEQQERQQTDSRSKSNSRAALQFEVNSADWMLDKDGKMYLIECNGIPVLYDPDIGQPLITMGLRLYGRLYKKIQKKPSSMIPIC